MARATRPPSSFVLFHFFYGATPRPAISGVGSAACQHSVSELLELLRPDCGTAVDGVSSHFLRFPDGWAGREE
jgi:hypothetical protein